MPRVGSGGRLHTVTYDAEAEPLSLEGYRGMLAQTDLATVPDLRHLDRAPE